MPGVGEAPGYLNPAGKRLWDDLKTQLADQLLDVDRAMFELMCAYYGAAQAALEDLNTRGPLVKGRTKDHSADEGDDEPTMVKNPSNQMAREASIQFREYAKEFGMSPAARKRIQMELGKITPKDDDAPSID